MKKQTFSINKYGIEKALHVGQKVIATYYHEYPDEKIKHGIFRSILCLFVGHFHPVKCGVIVGDAGFRAYWLANGEMEQYLYVKFPEYLVKKAIPISCLQDTGEYSNGMKALLEENKMNIGQTGYSLGSFITLSEWANKAENF